MLMNPAAGYALRWTGPLTEIVYFRRMEAIRKIIEPSGNPLTIELPEGFKNRKLEVIVLPVEESDVNVNKVNDLSEFFGKLEWKGDAVKEQRKLRDEWD